MIAAIVTGAGAGRRMESETPKVFLELNGFPVVYYSIRLFAQRRDIGKIIVTVPGSWKEKAEATASQWGFSGLEFIEGASTRQGSVFAALKRLPPDTRRVLIHDGARPLATASLVDAVLCGAETRGACIPVLPARETTKRVRGDRVIKTLDRNELAFAQTPQAFEFSSLLRAHELAAEQGFAGTDDASLLENNGMPVFTTPGEVSNVKITYPSDMRIAGALLDN